MQATLLPANTTPFEVDSWGVTLHYDQDGCVSDADAHKIDYDALLADMQDGTRQRSKDRVKQGYEPIELVGWAAKPYYDARAAEAAAETGLTVRRGARVLVEVRGADSGRTLPAGQKAVSAQDRPTGGCNSFVFCALTEGCYGAGFSDRQDVHRPAASVAVRPYVGHPR